MKVPRYVQCEESPKIMGDFVSDSEENELCLGAVQAGVDLELWQGSKFVTWALVD